MKGKWTGEYWNLQFTPENLLKSKTLFYLTIEDDEHSKLTGVIYDDVDGGGTAGTGTIEGKIDGDTITFVKRMPVRTLRLWNGTKIEDPDKPHAPIYYKGTINRKDNTVKGEWKFKRRIGFYKGKLYFSKGSKGEWEMQRETQIDNSKNT